MEAVAPVVYVEYCSGCEKHEWVCRHSPYPYQNSLAELERILCSNGRKCDFVKNDQAAWLSKVYARRSEDIVQEPDTWYPSIGAFEVTIGDVLLFSKLQLERFPTATELDLVFSHYENLKEIDHRTSAFNGCKTKLLETPAGRKLVHPSSCVLALIIEEQSKRQILGLRPYNTYEQSKRIELISSIYRIPPQQKVISINRTSREGAASSRQSGRSRQLVRAIEPIKENIVSKSQNIKLVPIADSPKSAMNDSRASNSQLRESKLLHNSINSSAFQHSRLSAPRIDSCMYDVAQQFMRRAKNGRMGSTLTNR